ncbi:MAG: rRNA pseudouridine synthase [Dehalococcoidia bacterium]|nr:rRNA pseudouridine synthase [Dehalococcoidia bacterium]|tara:strand:- start:892 stop:1653 length:762 start_codon:yes stop_codon:yes gene_type:complete
MKKLSNGDLNLIRLQKILSKCGYGSRRSCEELILEGRVSIDGQIATLGMKANPLEQSILLDGQLIAYPSEDTTIIMNKPNGFIVSTKDENGIPTIYNLLPYKPNTLRYAGRLDVNTEGLLLFSTDGELIYRLTHPKFEIKKVYEVVIEGRLSKNAQTQIKHGINLDGTLTKPADVKITRESNERSVVEITIHEGRNHQVRRMFDAIGITIFHLRRISIGPLNLGAMKRGKYKVLSKSELEKLRTTVGISSRTN